MGCGCKGKSSKLPKEPIEKTPTYYFKRIVSVILVSMILLILTPVIVIMIWYLGLKMIIGTDGDYIGMLVEKYSNLKNRSRDLEKVDKEEETEFNPDDYELLDVEVIK